MPLARNPDVLVELVAERAPGQLVVGFAAETGDDEGDVLTHARAKLARKGCDLLVVNDVSAGQVFGRPDNAVVVLGADGSVTDVPHGEQGRRRRRDLDNGRVTAVPPASGLATRPGRQPTVLPAPVALPPGEPRSRRPSTPPTDPGSTDVPRRLFTSESVTEGHPDKIADQISDSILDAMLAQDPRSRVAVETMITTGQVHIAGEVTTAGYVDIASIVRDTVLRIGYDSSRKGFDGASCGVSVSIGAQSPDIAQGVDTAYEARTHTDEDEIARQGAGDQGLMFGYATDETPELMPLPIALAHRLARRLSAVRKDGSVPYLRPDGKTQVTVVYEDDQPVAVDTVVVSSQHAEDISIEQLLTPDIKELVVEPELAALGLPTDGYRLLVNPTGKFVIGGPMGDAGPDRPQDHRRHLRRHGPPRRRCLLGQGPVEGRPLRRLRDALGGQERRRRGPGQALRGAGRLRDRRRAPGRPVRRDVRHRHRGRRRPREGDHLGVRPAPGRDRPRPRPAPADLRADRRLRALRPHRRRAPVGAADRVEALRAAVGA